MDIPLSSSTDALNFLIYEWLVRCCCDINKTEGISCDTRSIDLTAMGNMFAPNFDQAGNSDELMKKFPSEWSSRKTRIIILACSCSDKNSSKENKARHHTLIYTGCRNQNS